jgi:splicing factor 3B subunit 3
MSDPTLPLPRAYFQPRGLDNLTLVDELESLDPIVDAKVLNILPNSDSPQIFAACGRGARSSLRMLRHGLDVEEVVSSDLPGIPNAVWTTKLKEDGTFLKSFWYGCSILMRSSRSFRFLYHPIFRQWYTGVEYRRDN